MSPNVRGGTVRTFVDSDDLWPAAEEYAREHGMATPSDVVRLALRRLLRPERPDTQIGEGP